MITLTISVTVENTNVTQETKFSYKTLQEAKDCVAFSAIVESMQDARDELTVVEHRGDDETVFIIDADLDFPLPMHGMVIISGLAEDVRQAMAFSGWKFR